MDQAIDDECSSCGEDLPQGECDQSKRPCGHHCNHSWSQDKCCWCGMEFGEHGGEIPVLRGNPSITLSHGDVLSDDGEVKVWNAQFTLLGQGKTREEAQAAVLKALKQWVWEQQREEILALVKKEERERFFALARKLGLLPSSIMATRSPPAVLRDVSEDKSDKPDEEK